jgi:hypothetical protein
MLAPSLVATVLLGTGCGHRPATVGTTPTDPATVVERFMAAVKANDLPTMGRLWGTAKGPAAQSMPRDQLDKRLTVIQSYLLHDSLTILPGTEPESASNERVVRVQLMRLGCAPVVPFTLVRYRDGWLIREIDLEAAGNPKRPCG